MNAFIKSIIFDLDGVLVSTDELHYRAWKKTADADGIPFDRAVNERLRGISRIDSAKIIFDNAGLAYTEEQLADFAARKNDDYRRLITKLTPDDMLPGAMDTLTKLKTRRLPMAIGSYSKNTRAILAQIGLSFFFDAVVDGNQISHSKPNPEVFLTAAALLGIAPENSLVVEDAEAGIAAAKAGHMPSLGVSTAAFNPDAVFSAENIASADWDSILS